MSKVITFQDEWDLLRYLTQTTTHQLPLDKLQLTRAGQGFKKGTFQILHQTKDSYRTLSQHNITKITLRGKYRHEGKKKTIISKVYITPGQYQKFPDLTYALGLTPPSEMHRALQHRIVHPETPEGVGFKLSSQNKTCIVRSFPEWQCLSQFTRKHQELPSTLSGALMSFLKTKNTLVSNFILYTDSKLPNYALKQDGRILTVKICDDVTSGNVFVGVKNFPGNRTDHSDCEITPYYVHTSSTKYPGQRSLWRTHFEYLLNSFHEAIVPKTDAQKLAFPLRTPNTLYQQLCSLAMKDSETYSTASHRAYNTIIPKVSHLIFSKDEEGNQLTKPQLKQLYDEIENDLQKEAFGIERKKVMRTIKRLQNIFVYSRRGTTLKTRDQAREFAKKAGCLMMAEIFVGVHGDQVVSELPQEVQDYYIEYRKTRNKRPLQLEKQSETKSTIILPPKRNSRIYEALSP